MRLVNRRWSAPAAVALLAFVCCVTASANPVTELDAENVVIGWRAVEASPLGTPLGDIAVTVDTYFDDQGAPLYYVVYLAPEGFVIVPADDWIEPIIAFAPSGQYDPSPSNPLGALVTNDLKSRMAEVRQAQGAQQARRVESAGAASARDKWARFTGEAVPGDIYETGLSSVSDPRVDPFLQSLWNQTGDRVCGYTTYNYYTPSNYPCGCVATAMSQLMRYHQFPATGPGSQSFTISVCGANESRALRGGDGLGGVYDWANMVLDPNCPTTTQREAIGALCHDAGVSVNMDYCSGGSAADTLEVADALKNPFDYTNAKKGYNSGNNISSTTLNVMVNPNLHASYPVILGVTGTSGGHAVVCDGYGYDASTMYHHLNMGWSGSSNAWYNLPNIDSSPAFTSVYKSVYNVYTTGTGEIIAGRVLDNLGAPIVGASVTASPGGFTDTTDSRGIYALPRVSSSTTYSVTAQKTGYTPVSQNVTTATSSDNTTACGNKWPIDFALVAVTAECPDEGFETGTLTNLPWSTGGPPGWATTTAQYHTGAYSAMSGAITHGQTTYLQVALDRGSAGNVTFFRKVSSEYNYDKLRFLIDNTLQTGAVWSGEVAWNTTALSYPVTAGSHTYRWEYVKDGTGSSGSDAAWIDDIVFPADDGFESGGLATWPWQTGGDANWATTTGDKLRGSYSAKAGTITHSQSTYLQVTLTRSAGKVCFFPKVSSESGVDVLRFYIDDVEQGSWSGESAWGCPAVSYAVTAGSHTYKWVYSKNGSVSSGSDTAWIDEIIFPTPVPACPAPTSPGSTNITDTSIRWTWIYTGDCPSLIGFRMWANSGACPPVILIQPIQPLAARYWDHTSLLANSLYSFQVASYNGSDSAKTGCIQKYTLPIPPVYGASGDGAISCDRGPGGATWFPSGTTFTFTAVNGFGAGPTKAYKYQYVWNNSAAEPTWPSPNWNSGPLPLTAPTTADYYLHLRACNYDSAPNTTSLTLGPYKVDVTPPDRPIVTDDGTYQTSASQLHASWSVAPDAPSGLAEYQYSIGTTPGGEDVVARKSAGMNTQATEVSLSLTPGQAYYWSVWARDTATNWSARGDSDGIVVVENADVAINEAKALGDGGSVGLASKVVTAILGDVLYVEEVDRRMGIRVEVASVPAGLVVGRLADVGGVLSTNSGGERVVTGAVSVRAESAEVAPIGMNGRVLGGGPWAYNSGTGAGQQGIEGAGGLNNIGLLVRTWGKVIDAPSGTFASWNLDTNPGWSTQNQWAFGTPTGGGGGSHGYPDPTSGHTGTNVYGVNLLGDYSLTVGGPWYLKAGPIDCSARLSVLLRFWRKLNTDLYAYVPATVEVSDNNTSWTSVWSNATPEPNDSTWVFREYSISSTADGKSTVYIRWGYQVKASAWAYSGWNIDDIELFGQGTMRTIDDGSGEQVLLIYPQGVTPPALDDYAGATGISSCYRDGEGKVRRLVLVTQ